MTVTCSLSKKNTSNFPSFLKGSFCQIQNDKFGKATGMKTGNVNNNHYYNNNTNNNVTVNYSASSKSKNVKSTCLTIILVFLECVKLLFSFYD